MLRIPAATETAQAASLAAQPCPAPDRLLVRTLHSFAMGNKEEYTNASVAQITHDIYEARLYQNSSS